MTTTAPSETVDCRVVALTHYLPPYMAGVLRELSLGARDFQLLLSIDQEPNRQFGDTWGALKVDVQKSLMLRRPWKHGKAKDGESFTDELYIHFPYDTFSQLRRRQPDIVFAYELGFRSLISALYCKIYRKKLALCVCVSEHTERFRGRLRGLLRRWLLKQADAVSYNGPSCKAYLSRFDVPESKLFHFPYAIAQEFHFDGELEREPHCRKRLICIGQLSERKGVLPLLEGLISYCQSRKERNLEIDLIGKGPLESHLKSLRLPPNLQVNFLGHIPYQQLGEKMANAGVLVFPTLADEWGLVVNEAFATGMPVIGSRFGQAATTLIEDGVNGWQYDPTEQDSFFKTLDELNSTSDEKLLAMRRNAQQRVADITATNVAASALSKFAELLKS